MSSHSTCGLSEDINLPLNDRQIACVEYYLSHLPYNRCAAYSATFPSDKRSPQVLKNKASEFFKNPRVKKYLKERMEEMLEEANVNAQTIALRLATIAFDEKPENVSSSLKALDLLQKQFGLQNKNINMNGEVAVGVTIVDDYGEQTN